MELGSGDTCPCQNTAQVPLVEDIVLSDLDSESETENNSFTPQRQRNPLVLGNNLDEN